MITIRSVMAKTSGRVCEMRMTGTLLLAQRVDERHDLALLGHAEVVRGLVHDHQARVPVDGARDGHGLTLATGELLDLQAHLRDDDAQAVEDGRGLGAHLAPRRAS